MKLPEAIIGQQFKIEEQLQAACTQWFHNTYYLERGMLHMNDNNSYNRIEGNRKKAMGVVSGVSDLELISDGGVVWFIELKLPEGKQSDVQIDFMNKCRTRGHIYVLIYSLEQFKYLIKEIIGH